MMDTGWKTEYRQKLMTAAQAAALVESGDHVYIGTASTVAYDLANALHDRRDELEDVCICSGLNVSSVKVFDDNSFGHYSYFMGSEERKALANGCMNYSSIHLSLWHTWIRDIAGINVAFCEVTPPDENGYMNYSSNGAGLMPAIKEHADKIIVSVNPNAVWCYGLSSTIHVSEVTAIVESSTDLAAIPEPYSNETLKVLSSYIVDQIPDGATIQLGAGRLGTAVGYGLACRNDLGIHTEMISDSMMKLMQDGNVTNAKKTWYPGQSVIGFAFGSRRLYDFLDHNPECYFLPLEVVNDPVNIAKNDNMISINGAVEIDLTGQVAAEAINGVQYSGIGGQVDYVRGAQMAKGGKSFIATESTFGKGERLGSRIVCSLPTGTAVTTSRADVQYVATEYGCVNLKPLSMPDRVRAMISLAHPKFRGQLETEAKEKGLI